LYGLRISLLSSITPSTALILSIRKSIDSLLILPANAKSSFCSYLRRVCEMHLVFLEHPVTSFIKDCQKTVA
jgi:hypothetical protein